MIERLKQFYSLGEIERYCGMPARTLRGDRKVPEKYLDKIREMEDGLGSTKVIREVVKEVVKEIVEVPFEGEEYELRNGMIGKVEGGLFRRVIFADGTKFYKKS